MGAVSWIFAFHNSPGGFQLLDTICQEVLDAFMSESGGEVDLRVLKQDSEGAKAKLVGIVENNLLPVTTV